MKAMSRRHFLGRGALVAFGASVVNQLRGGRMLSQAFADCSTDLGVVPDGLPILVLVNLFGGNDGLNTVIPLDEFEQYEALRPNLKLPRRRLLELNEGTALNHFALNPGMQETARLFNEERVVAIINGVSPPAQITSGLFDHEASQSNLQSGHLVGGAFTVAYQPNGWVGRLNDRLSKGKEDSIVGTDFGGGGLMLTGGVYAPLSLRAIDTFDLRISLGDEAMLRDYYSRIQGLQGQFRGAAEANRRIRARMLALSSEIRCRTTSYPPPAVTYPADGLGPVLLDVARLIWARIPIQTYAVGMGGFDTHANQNAGAEDTNEGYTLGAHDQLLAQVSQAVNAFYRDLQAHQVARDVVILIVTEFGRRANSDVSGGTDHGFSGPVFAIGEKVRGGLYQPYPSPSDLWLYDHDNDHRTDTGNLKHTTDFRRVYEQIYVKHFRAPSDKIYGEGNLLPDERALGPQLVRDFL